MAGQSARRIDPWFRISCMCAALTFAFAPFSGAEPPGRAAYLNAYERFMQGDLAGARQGFETVRDLAGADEDYAADAGLRAGWLFEVAGRLNDARNAFEKVEGASATPALWRAESLIGLGQCAFLNGDGIAASNAFERAIVLLETGPIPGPYRYYARWLTTYAVSYRDLTALDEDDPYYNNRMRRRAVKWPSPIEQSAREEILRRWLSEHGLGPERCYLKGQWVSGTRTERIPYPPAGFPYTWEFEDNTMSGLTLLQGLNRARAEEGCLKFTTTERSGFGWGPTSRSDAQPGLHFGYATNLHESLPRLTHLCVRLRQSLPESTWRVRVGGLPRRRTSGYQAWDSPPVTVRGTDWQEIPFRINAGDPPYLGVQFFCDTPGNEVEIDWVRPEVRPGPIFARKEFDLPADVRWAKISVAAGGPFRVFVNGREAVRSAPDVLAHGRQIWNYDLESQSFRTGGNVVALELETSTAFLVDGALLCVDGTHLRFDTDQSWKYAPLPDSRWSAPDNETAHSWEAVRVEDAEPMPLDYRSRYWFNPSYKGGLMVQPADGRPQPVYGSRESVALSIAVPAQQSATPEVRWTLFDAMGDGVRPIDKEVSSGILTLRPEPGLAAGTLSFAAGTLSSNTAYALDLNWVLHDVTVDTRRYELAVCGPVVMPEIASPGHYTDGMELKRVWEMHAADDPPPDGFISMDGTALPRPSTVIETPLGRFRQPYPDRNLGSLGGSPCNYFSYRYRIENPGRPHVAIAEYPDDTVRVQEMRITEDGNVRRPGLYAGIVLANDTVVLGFDNPLTHEMRQHHCLFFPGRQSGTITFLTLGMENWGPETAARVGNIRIYEVMNDVPARRMADAPGPRKWVGQLTERGPSQIWASCFSSPLSSYFRNHMLLSDSPVFYRNWMVAAVNMVKRMKFSGENAHFMGQYMYHRVIYPSAFSEHTAAGVSGSLRDYGVLLARMFDENDLGLFSTLQLIGSLRIPLTGSDEAVAAGAPTFAQVDREGRQTSILGHVTPNWIHPDVRGLYERIIGEVTDLYAGEPGWKGIVLHQHDVVGPSWYAPGHQPGAASYDDVTTSLFEKQTDVRVPVDVSDPDRFAKRHAWLNGEAERAWQDWRCDTMQDIYEWTAKHLKAQRPDLDLIVYAYASYLTPPLDEPPEHALPSLFDYGRRGGIDLERIKRHPDMILAGNVFVSLEVAGADTISGDFEAWLRGKHDQIGRGRALAHRESVLASLANDGKSGLAVRYNWYEAQPRGPEYWLWTISSPESWPYPQDDYFADYWINSFVRAHPRLILHPLMDVLLWNGREVSMSRFAQAFRSLAATVYTPLTDNGRDRNVRIALGTYEGDTYGYVANTHWWETDVTLTLASGIHGRELTEGVPIENGSWQGRLGPYSMRTFRFPGTHPEAIAHCQAVVSDKGRGEIERRIVAWHDALAEHGPALDKIGRTADFRAVGRKAAAALQRDDVASAYDRLTGYPARRLQGLLEPRTHSPFIAEGWLISRLLPRDGRPDIRALDPVCPDDASLEWRPLNVTGNRILVRAHYGDRDGFVYFANRIRVPVAGEWTLCVGHDGGCRVFVDGREALAQPRRRNPIREDRTKATLTLERGDHDIVVAFDTDHGMGWGLTLRFQAPDGMPRLALDFPAPSPTTVKE